MEEKLKSGDLRTITAHAAPAGFVFGQWTGDISHLTDPSSSTTIVTMPAEDITVAANYNIFHEEWVELLSLSTNSPIGAYNSTFDPSITSSSGQYKWIVDGIEYLSNGISITLDTGAVKSVSLFGQGSCKITGIDIGYDSIIGTVDVSNPAFYYCTNFNLGGCYAVDVLVLPTTHFSPLVNLNLYLGNVIGELDLSHFSSLNYASISIGQKYFAEGVYGNSITGIKFAPVITGTIKYLSIGVMNGVTSLDLSMLNKWSDLEGNNAGMMYIQRMPVSGILFPTSITGIMRTISISKLYSYNGAMDLTGFSNFNGTGSMIQISYISASDFLFTETMSGSLGYFDIHDCVSSNGTLDLSGVIIANDCSINIYNLPLLSTLLLNNMPTGNISNLYISNVGCSNTLNLNLLANSTDELEVVILNAPNISQISMPVSISGKIQWFSIDNTSITFLDIAWLTNVNTEATIKVLNCNYLSNVITPVRIYGNVYQFEFSQCPLLPYISMLIFDEIFSINDADISIWNCAWSAAKVNQALYELSTWIPLIYIADACCIHFENNLGGNDNAKPDTTSGGYNGIAAKAILGTFIETATA